MRILQVITSMRIGGAEHVVVQLMRLKGHEVDVAVFDGTDTAFTKEIEQMGGRIYRLGHGPYDLRHILRLRRLMKEYDIVHTHNSSPQLFAAIANVGMGKKLVTTEHSTNNRKREHPVFAAIDRWMYHRYDKIVTISQIAEEKLCQYLGMAETDALRRRIVTINNGVDVNGIFHAAPLDELRHDGRFVTVMVAGFREAKDQDTAIRAMALLPEEYELWLVGDGVRRPIIEQLIVDKALSHRVKLLGIRADVPRILKSADVTVMSSHWEGLSLSNIEGMSSGKPFIASEVNGLKEVTAGYGILFPHGDAEALAGIIRQLHDDPVYYREVAMRCHERALQYDIQKMVDGYEQVYIELSNHEV